MIDNPRVDLVIARYGRWVLIALLVVGVCSVAAAGWAVATPPPTTTETDRVGEERVATTLEASATVTGDTDLWAEGTVLSDQPVYLREAAPVLTLEPSTELPDDDATVTHEVVVTLEAERDGRVFYNETAFEDRQEVSVENGVATSGAEVDVADVADRRAALEEQLGGVASVEKTVAVYATIESEDGAWYDSTPGADPTLSTSLEVSEEAYWLESVEPAERTEPITVTREVEEPRNATLIGALAALGVVSFGAAAFVYGRRDVDVEAARSRVQKRRYAEWISHGSMPMWIGDHQIELDSLEDVVDVAIDTGERVVHDRNRELFAVVSDDVVYYYGARGSWSETAWPRMDLTRPATDPDDPPSDSPPEPEPTIPIPDDDLPDPDDEDAWKKL